MPPTIQEYREFAHECYRWADETKDLEIKLQFLELAKHWLWAAMIMQTDELRRDEPDKRRMSG